MVVLFNICPILEIGVVWLLAPEIPVGLVTVQVYVVPAGKIKVGALFAKGTVKAVPLQVLAVWFGINGFGLTVTVIVKFEPIQFPVSPEVGVTV